MWDLTKKRMEVFANNEHRTLDGLATHNSEIRYFDLLVIHRELYKKHFSGTVFSPLPRHAESASLSFLDPFLGTTVARLRLTAGTQRLLTSTFITQSNTMKHLYEAIRVITIPQLNNVFLQLSTRYTRAWGQVKRGQDTSPD